MFAFCGRPPIPGILGLPRDPPIGFVRPERFERVGVIDFQSDKQAAGHLSNKSTRQLADAADDQPTATVPLRLRAG